MVRRTLGLLALVVVASVATTAHADDDVDEGVRLIGLARFDEALAAFARAEAGDDLSRADLAVLLESRAIVLAAMGRVDAMERDLAGLAALEPARSLPAAAPPEVVARWSAIVATARPLELLAVASWDVGVVTVRAVSDGDPGGLVRRIRVGARLVGRDYALGDGRVQLMTADASSVEYFAEAIGPGGAVVAAAGSADAPLSSAPPPRVATVPPASGTVAGGAGPAVVEPSPRNREGADGPSVGVWLAIGGGVLVVAAAVIVGVLVATSQGSPDTALGGPIAVAP